MDRPVCEKVHQADRDRCRAVLFLPDYGRSICVSRSFGLFFWFLGPLLDRPLGPYGSADERVRTHVLPAARSRPRAQSPCFDPFFRVLVAFLSGIPFEIVRWVLMAVLMSSNVYGPTFYQQLGLGPELFTYQTVGQGVGIAVSIIGIILIDRIGRRPPILFGACMLFVCNILIGTLGPKTPNISKTEQGVVIASIMLLLSGLKLSFQCGACECLSPPLVHPACSCQSGLCSDHLAQAGNWRNTDLASLACFRDWW